MKTTIALICLIALCAANPDMFVGTQEEIDYINSVQDSWVAGENQFSGMTHDEVKTFFTGLIQVPIDPRPDPEAAILSEFIDLPESFNAETNWNLNSKLPVRDQQRCGSCWAFSSAEVLADRFDIQTQGGTAVVLSTQDMISCDRGNMGCQGGYLTKTWDYLAETGVVSEACYPYTSGAGHVGSCSRSCTGSGTWKKYQATSYHTFTTVNAIKQEVYTNGPIQTGFNVYADFMTYHSGVYVHTSGKLEGGHAVKIVGWGNDAGQDYWVVQNSWSSSWGLNGFFWMGMNQHGLNFEASGIAGKANV